MRAYCKLHPPKEDSKKGLTAVAKAILSKEMKYEIDFTIRQGRQIDKSVPRFLPNPEAHWGPKRRAGRLVQDLEKQQDEEQEEEEEPAEKKARSDEN